MIFQECMQVQKFQLDAHLHDLHLKNKAHSFSTLFKDPKNGIQ